MNYNFRNTNAPFYFYFNNSDFKNDNKFNPAIYVYVKNNDE